MDNEGLLGLEVRKLDKHDPRAPWQMTVDVWEQDEAGERIIRYMLRGMFYEREERTLEDIARVQPNYKRRDEIAAELDRLDREAGKEIAQIIRRLKRAQLAFARSEEDAVLVFGPDPSSADRKSDA